MSNVTPQVQNSPTLQLPSQPHDSPSSMDKKGNKARKPRKRWGGLQLEKLETLFKMNQNPKSEEMDHLANDLQAQVSDVKTWFQNRRAKEKKRGSPSGETVDITTIDGKMHVENGNGTISSPHIQTLTHTTIEHNIDQNHHQVQQQQQSPLSSHQPPQSQSTHPQSQHPPQHHQSPSQHQSPHQSHQQHHQQHSQPQNVPQHHQHQISQHHQQHSHQQLNPSQHHSQHQQIQHQHSQHSQHQHHPQQQQSQQQQQQQHQTQQQHNNTQQTQQTLHHTTAHQPSMQHQSHLQQQPQAHDTLESCPNCSPYIEKLNQRIKELEDQCQQYQLQMFSPVPTAPPPTIPPPISSPKRERDPTTGELLDESADKKLKRSLEPQRLFKKWANQVTRKIKGAKFFEAFGVPTAPVVIEEACTKEMFDACFESKGRLIQPTPDNKPYSTVTIRRYEGFEEVHELFGEGNIVHAGHPAWVWRRNTVNTRSGEPRDVKLHRRTASIDSLEVHYNRNTMRLQLTFTCTLTSETAQPGAKLLPNSFNTQNGDHSPHTPHSLPRHNLNFMPSQMRNLASAGLILNEPMRMQHDHDNSHNSQNNIGGNMQVHNNIHSNMHAMQNNLNMQNNIHSNLQHNMHNNLQNLQHNHMQNGMLQTIPNMTLSPHLTSNNNMTANMV